MNKQICDFVSPRTEPDFFDHLDAGLQGIHAEIQRSIEAATAVMTIDLDPELVKHAETKLTKIGWTLERGRFLSGKPSDHPVRCACAAGHRLMMDN